MVQNTPNAPANIPAAEPLSQDILGRLEAVRQQIGQENNPAFVGLALQKLQRNVSRTELAEQIRQIQSLNEFKQASEALRTRMSELQQEVAETPTQAVLRIGSETVQTVSAVAGPAASTIAANAAPVIQQTSRVIPEWAQLPVIGGVLYAGMKAFSWIGKRLGNTGKAIAKPIDYAAHVVGEVGLWSGAWLMLAKAYERISGKSSESH